MANTVVMFNDLYLEENKEVQIFTYKGKTIEVKQYLPIEKKAELISYILNHAIDMRTNTFSPLRVSVYFMVGVVEWYSNITFEDTQLHENAPATYDLMKSDDFFNHFLTYMDEDEFDYLNKTMKKVLSDYETYANSFVGMLSTMNSDASNMNKEIEEIMNKIKNKEGLEELAAIKDIVG